MGKPKVVKDAIPTFVQVLQPEYSWDEVYADSIDGATLLPNPDNTLSDSAHPAGGNATIIVPASPDTPMTRMVRLHEMLHARFTPEIQSVAHAARNAGTLNEVAMQVAEDVRLSHLGKKLGVFDEDMFFDEKTRLSKLAASHDEMQRALVYMASYGIPRESGSNPTSLKAMIKETGVDYAPKTVVALEAWHERVSQIVEIDDAKEQFLALAKATETCLQEIFYEKQPPQPEEKPGDKSRGNKAGKPDEKSPEEKAKGMQPAKGLPRHVKNGSELFNTKLPEYIPNRKKEIEQVLRKMKRARINFPQLDSAKWGQMSMHTAPLTKASRAIVRREGRATVDGVVPAHWSRWYSDRAVFTRKGKRKGGTLLIDVSGSMGWAHTDTVHLMELAPAMTIAVYSGGGEGDDDNRSGKLTIIAKNGRTINGKWRYREDGGHGGANVVDGHALMWLSNQTAPRVWFSDGQVTGINEWQGPCLNSDVERITRFASIKRTVKVSDVAKLLDKQTDFEDSEEASEEDN